MGHIVRVDKPKNDPTKGTHGWQVRVAGKGGYHSKLFSDNVYGSRDKALVAAEEYLAEYVKVHPEEGMYPYYHAGKLYANNKSRVTGVFCTQKYGQWDRKKERKRYYWGAFYSIDGRGRKQVKRYEKFYVEEWGEAEATSDRVSADVERSSQGRGRRGESVL